MNARKLFVIAAAVLLITARTEAQSVTTLGPFIQQGFTDIAGAKAQGIGMGLGLTIDPVVAQVSGQINESKIWTGTAEVGGRWYPVHPVYLGVRGGLVIYHDGRTDLPDNRWRPMMVGTVGFTGVFRNEVAAHDLQFDFPLLPARQEDSNPGFAFWVRYCYRFKIR